MPCDSLIRTTVDFGGQGVELAAVARALVGLGYQANVQADTLTFWGLGFRGSLVKGGRLVASGSRTFDPTALKVAYAGEVVKAAAARYGWAVQEQEAAVARLW